MYMKIRMFFIAYIFIAFANFSVNAQSTHLEEIAWEGVQTWEAELSSKDVLSFESAHYLYDNDLPYFVKQVEANSSDNYKVSLLSCEFEPLSLSERALITTSFNVEPEVLTSYSYDRDKTYLNIQVLPFVEKDGEVLRLKSFILDVKKKEGVRKSNQSTTAQYASSSVLASGKFVKIAVKESGIYRLTYEELSSMGINPGNVRIFGYGGELHDQNLINAKPDDLPEVAIYMHKGSDGVFNAGDYILFYGQGVIDWNYDPVKRIFTHKLNHYSTEGYYFVTSDAGVGKKIELNEIDVPGSAPIMTVNQFVDYDVHERELYNLGRTGKVFYGEEFNSSRKSHVINFDFPNILSGEIQTIFDMAVTNGIASTVNIDFNNSQEKTINIPNRSVDNYTVGFPIFNSYAFSNSNADNNLNFKITYNLVNASQKAYLNYVEVNVRRELKMDGNVMLFRNFDNLSSEDFYNKFVLSNAGANTEVWDISDPLQVKKLPTTLNGSTLEFIDVASEQKEYVAINITSNASYAYKPRVVGTIPNQNLHALPSADFTIITHPLFLAQAERLANAHRTIDGMSVNVITTEQVYNEFSSGTPDATAYRRVMKMWYDKTNKQGPKYLLLFGRGSYDNRGIVNNSGDNLVLTYQADNSLNDVKSYVTDDYFGFLDEGEGVNLNSDLLDLGIGRFPVATYQHAEDVVNKMISYMNNEERGIWKNQLAFVADDGDAGLHMRDIDTQVAKVTQSQTPSFQISKIYLDAFKKEFTASGESYPLVETKLKSLINSGLLMLNFMGHANEHGWTKERIISTQDIRSMYNTKLPLWVAATCDFVMFDKTNISAGEHVLLNPSGGGIGLFSAARVVYAAENAKLNNKFTLNLFKQDSGGNMPRLGDVVRKAKNDVGGGMNKLSYMLFGNPALKLAYPSELSIETVSINGEDANGQVLKALSVNEIKAHIVDRNGNKVSAFNGLAEVSIYDKEQSITTLNNQNGGAITYQDRPNMIFSGKVKVVNGEFSVVVMVPRDIRYNYGSGRINYYASEDNGGREAQGYFEGFSIGGSADVSIDDLEGPNVSVYLNKPDFISGSKVNETPIFVANIFDENGINTVGSGIGHDLKLVVDHNPHTTFTVNEFFEADEGSYQSGQVKFKLPTLEKGKHTLTFYAWDLLNNSTSVTIDFEVVPGLVPEIFSVSNYPNPVRTSTKFVIEHDRPETVLESHLQIFDLAGRKIFDKQYSNSDNMRWDLQDSSGSTVSPGVYIYKISIKTLNSEFTSKANKVIVVGQ